MSESENGGRVSGLVNTADLVDGIDGIDDIDSAQFFDALFAVLSDRRRRSLLHHLHIYGAMEVDSLAAAIAADEQGTTTDAVTDDEADAIRLQLFHRHLPKLVDAGFVEHDREEGLVSLTDLGSHLDDRVLERTLV